MIHDLDVILSVVARRGRTDRGRGRAGAVRDRRHRQRPAALRRRRDRQRNRQPRGDEARAQDPLLPGGRLRLGRLRRQARARLPAPAGARRRLADDRRRGARASPTPIRCSTRSRRSSTRCARAGGRWSTARRPCGRCEVAERIRSSLETGMSVLPLRVLLVAGEASGDLHGAALVRALRRRVPDIEVSGRRRRALAGRRHGDPGRHGRASPTMGFTETFGTLGRLLAAYRRLVRFLDEERPDLVVLVDYPEFNLMIARQAKRRGIRVFYFIGPQVWAWRRAESARSRRRVDKMASGLPVRAGALRGQRARPGRVHRPPAARLVARPTRGAKETRRALRAGAGAPDPRSAARAAARRSCASCWRRCAPRPRGWRTRGGRRSSPSLRGWSRRTRGPLWAASCLACRWWPTTRTTWWRRRTPRSWPPAPPPSRRRCWVARW